ncbi:MAG: gliding-motility protein MglA [Deltaproteobacteria bacterium]|nr:gliding-motility protein MglA [Deltaproteobacteria bacterium]
MAFINEKSKEINCKIVYYGPPRCGKSTSLKQICSEIKKDTKGELISLTSDDDKTLYFDFVPITLGKLKDFTIRLHLYTVPGEVAYEANRKIISKGVDGVVFVADSQIEKVELNLSSMRELKDILKHEGVDFIDVPHVIQYNKRDLPNAAPLLELRKLLNKHAVPDFETVATKGSGVFDAFQSISSKVLMDLKKVNV